MMRKSAYHICLSGRVQGVGFRPRVYQLAQQKQLNGWVINDSDGIRIHCETDLKNVLDFRDLLLTNLPSLAVVTDVSIVKANWEDLTDFRIRASEALGPTRTLITPDIATCPECLQELNDPSTCRFQYPFTTCTNCGPRYSIITGIPYDRPNTSMVSFPMCAPCELEFHDPNNRRYFAQTSSCPHCRIEISLSTLHGIHKDVQQLSGIIEMWDQGLIVAIKGIGGYLLTCDATNSSAISRLRNRKQRPEKPLAVMYPRLELIRRDTEVSNAEAELLNSKHSPIVLLELKPDKRERAEIKELTRGLDKLGAMLPYTPLYHILLQKFGKPIVATSGNLSNSTIIFEDNLAERELMGIADAILMNNRVIATPQDDGIEKVSQKHEKRILLRRSRGLAPSYIHPQLRLEGGIFAAGALLKSSFGLTHEGNIYVSQFLGNGIHFEAQQNYKACYHHLSQLLKFSPDTVVTDLHPDFHSALFGSELARQNGAELLHLQHHKAHFYAVLGENNLIDDGADTLGIIWDGLGLGEDGEIWGGELFRYRKGNIERLAHLDYFPVIARDKMSIEPRLSLFSIGWDHEKARKFIREKFGELEIKLYRKIRERPPIYTSSIGRLFDAFASLILDHNTHHYEAEAAIKLEQSAARAFYTCGVLPKSYFEDKQNTPLMQQLLDGVTNDLGRNLSRDEIALNFHYSLVKYLKHQVAQYDANQLAFSGGVFQNSLLTDLIIDELEGPYKLYFHKELPPNDECIALGQLIWANARKLGIFE